MKAGVEEDCKYYYSPLNTWLDLSPLKKEGGYTIKGKEAGSSDEYTYKLNVCGALNDGSPCDGAGACQANKTGDANFQPHKMGEASSKLSFASNELVLKYTGGEKCHNDKYSRQTIIIFFCKVGALDTKPVFSMELEDCVYVFHWDTDLACLPGQVGF